MPLRVVDVADHLARQLQPPRALVDGVDVLDAHGEARGVVVAQVLADAGKRMAHLDAERLEQRWRTNARKLQQLGGIVAAAGEDDLASRAHGHALAAAAADAVGDPYRTLSLEQDLGGVRTGAHRHVRALARRVQEGGGGADAAAVVDGALGVGDAFLDGAVVVGVARDAEADRALDEGLAQRVAPVDVGDREAAVAAAVGGVAIAEAPLHALEVGEHVGVAPAAIAELRPGVEVHALAAIVDVAVDGAGAAERLAARREDAPPAGPLAGLHAVEPVHARVVVGLDEAGGDMDEGVPVAGAGLEHQHGRRAVLAQPVGEHAAGRTRPDDDVVEGLHPRFPHGSLGAHFGTPGRLEARGEGCVCVRCQGCNKLRPSAGSIVAAAFRRPWCAARPPTAGARPRAGAPPPTKGRPLGLTTKTANAASDARYSAMDFVRD